MTSHLNLSLLCLFSSRRAYFVVIRNQDANLLTVAAFEDWVVNVIRLTVTLEAFCSLRTQKSAFHLFSDIHTQLSVIRVVLGQLEIIFYPTLQLYFTFISYYPIIATWSSVACFRMVLILEPKKSAFELVLYPHIASNGVVWARSVTPSFIFFERFGIFVWSTIPPSQKPKPINPRYNVILGVLHLTSST